MKTRGIALICVVALLAAGCGSRLSNEELASGAGTGEGGVAPVDRSATEGPGIDNTGKGGPKIGTLPVPCGKGTPKAPPAGVDGVTDKEIQIAVISDKSGQIKVPTASIEQSMMAFVKWCNDFGGINGRTLVLKKIDSKLFSHLEATQEACNSKVFAIVGSGSVTDNQGAQAMVDCKLIEVPAYAATAGKAMSDRQVEPLPNPTDHYGIGGAKYIKKEHPKAIKKAAIIWGNIDTAANQAKRIEEAYEKLGYKFVYKKATQIIQESYASEAKAMKSKGVEYINFVNTTAEAVKLLRDMRTQDFDPEVKELGQQYYDPELLDAGAAAEGTLVQLNTAPFEEVDDIPALAAYLAAYDKIDNGGIKPTSLGVQSFSAGLLFATAVKKVGDDITRDKVLAELKKIHKWDGGGLHYVADPGGNTANDCPMYSVVHDKKFERLYPEKVGTYACGKDNVVTLKGDYGEGAKEH